MGFGSLFLGFMFLYDFQTALVRPGTQEIYAVLDIFPNVIGFLLLFLGLRTLAKERQEFVLLKHFAFGMTAFSLFILAKDTLLYSSFYLDGVESLAGKCIGFCQHLLILAFAFLLFQKTGPVLQDLGEEKLARTHSRAPVFAVMEGAVYALCFVLCFFRLEGVSVNILQTLRFLNMLLWVFFVWYGAIALFRAMLKTQD